MFKNDKAVEDSETIVLCGLFCKNVQMTFVSEVNSTYPSWDLTGELCRDTKAYIYSSCRRNWKRKIQRTLCSVCSVQEKQFVFRDKCDESDMRLCDFKQLVSLEQKQRKKERKETIITYKD